MSACDAGDGIFKSYVTNISAEHLLDTTTKGCYAECDNTWYLGAGNDLSRNSLLYLFLCDLCHNIYHMVAFRPEIFSPDYMWNSTAKIWVRARLVKRVDLKILTSHMSQCLRNYGSAEGRHVKFLKTFCVSPNYDLHISQLELNHLLIRTYVSPN